MKKFLNILSKILKYADELNDLIEKLEAKKVVK